MISADLPDPDRVERLLAAIERHPFAVLALIVFMALGVVMVVSWP